jgi:hypothetical protein
MSQTQNISDISWDTITEAVLSDKFVEAFAQIPKEALEFASNEANRKFIVQSVFKSLQDKNPDMVTQKKAELVTDKLMEYARLQLNEKI